MSLEGELGDHRDEPQRSNPSLNEYQLLPHIQIRANRNLQVCSFEAISVEFVHVHLQFDYFGLLHHG